MEHDVVSVTAHRHGDNPTVYRIEICRRDGEIIVLWRRFKHLKLFHKALSEIHTYDIGLPTFPQRKLFGRFDREVIELRRSSVESLFVHVTRLPKLFNSAVVSSFISKEDDCPVFNDEIDEAIMTSRKNERPAKTIITAQSLDESSSSRKMSIVSNFISGGGRRDQEASLQDFKVLSVNEANIMVVRKLDTGRVYALKVFAKIELDDHLQATDPLVTGDRNLQLEDTQHPFTAGIEFCFQTDDRVYVVIEYVTSPWTLYSSLDASSKPLSVSSSLSNTRLLTSATCLSESFVQFYAAEILCGVAHLHSRGIICRDLAPHNILIAPDGHVKLSFFGPTLAVDQRRDAYAAPETTGPSGFTRASDWYSFGAILYELLTGVRYIRSLRSSDVEDSINSGLHCTFDKSMSDDARSLLAGLLTCDVSERLGSGSMDGEELKSHPFFSGVDFTLLEAKAITPPQWSTPHADCAGNISHFERNDAISPTV